MIIKILQHTIEYNWLEDGFKDDYINGLNIDHIRHLIKEGYNQGELIQSTFIPNKKKKPAIHEMRGWWKINKTK